MEICSFISKQKYFSQIYPVTTIAVSVTMQNTTSYWMTLCIDVVSIMFSSDALPMRKLNKFWITAILEHVAVIYLGWIQLRKSFAMAISGLQSLKIVTRILRNAHPGNIFIQKSAPILLCYTPSLLLAHLSNGGLNLCIVILPQPRGMVTSS